MTTAALRYKASHSKTLALHVPKMQWKLLYAVGILVSFAMLILYIVQINQLTSGAYVIKSYNKEISALTTQNRDLQTHFAETDFLGAVQNRAAGLSFEKTANIQYVQILDSSLGMVK